MSFLKIKRIMKNEESVYVLVSYMITNENDRLLAQNFIGMSFRYFPTIKDITDVIREDFNIDNDKIIRIFSLSKLTKKEYSIFWSEK